MYQIILNCSPQKNIILLVAVLNMRFTTFFAFENFASPSRGSSRQAFPDYTAIQRSLQT